MSRYAQTQEPERTQLRQMNNEDSLIRETLTAKQHVENYEQNPDGWAVVARCWISNMPSRPEGTQSPFDILAARWIRPLPPGPAGPRVDQEQVRRFCEDMTAELRNRVRSLERRVAESTRLRQEDEERHEAQLEDLQEQLETLTRAYEVQEDQIRQLERDRNLLTRECHDLQGDLRRVRWERQEARAEIEQLRRELEAAAVSVPLPPNSYQTRGRRSRWSSGSGSSGGGSSRPSTTGNARTSSGGSSRTYVQVGGDPLDKVGPRTSRSSRHNSSNNDDSRSRSTSRDSSTRGQSRSRSRSRADNGRDGRRSEDADTHTTYLRNPVYTRTGSDGTRRRAHRETVIMS